ncbi:unnamed protein product [Effrenium voratum]|nr:unnamed protein product [Effrenium voratum]
MAEPEKIDSGCWATQASGSWAFSAQFFILSWPSGSGKTTFLQSCARHFRANGLRVGGVLAPLDPAGRRQLQLVSSGEVLEFQMNDGKPGDGSGQPASASGDGVAVGNFLFAPGAFVAAREELRRLRGADRGIAAAPADWVLIDEVGPLEMRGEGLEPALGELLRAAAAGDLGPPQSRFLLVARHGLREAVVKTYGLDGTGQESDAEEVFPGFGGPDARAAAVVDLGLEDRDELIERLAKLPPLL